jgi:beta-galactosidase
MRILPALLIFIIVTNAIVARNLTSEENTNRVKENFDFSWLFHKGDIAMKLVVRVGQGGITDINVPIITKNDTVIDYSNFRSSTAMLPSDWKEVNLPHDWVVEGSFVHDNDLGSQPAGSGYLPTGIGFYRKEFEIPDRTKERKYPSNSTGFSGTAPFGSTDIY